MQVKRITVDETNQLKEFFQDKGVISKLLILLSANDLIGKEFVLSKVEDASGLGVSMQWLTLDEQIDEAFNFYPGIAAINFDYVPIGNCMRGSGDPYFVKDDKDILKIYRIPHDSVLENDKLDQSQIEYICTIEKLLDKI